MTKWVIQALVFRRKKKTFLLEFWLHQISVILFFQLPQGEGQHRMLKEKQHSTCKSNLYRQIRHYKTCRNIFNECLEILSFLKWSTVEQEWKILNSHTSERHWIHTRVKDIQISYIGWMEENISFINIEQVKLLAKLFLFPT